MRRRALLASVAMAVSAGCTSEYAPSGPRTPPGADDARSEPGTGGSGDGDEDTPGLFILEWDFFEGEAGKLVVEAVVGNDAETELSGTVVVVATGPDRSVEATEDVTVAPDETTDVNVRTDLEHEAFVRDGELSVDVESN
ncbi:MULTISPECIES: hypothetical protein [unclassified Haloparvum]|uniref:hypothetical protein n=1 Tax=Haloparvum sp. PAK95 TaxID=3418962 RepID=UPI003D2EE5EE